MHARTHTRNVYGLLGNLERSAVHYRFSRQLYQLCTGTISNIKETIRGYIAFSKRIKQKMGHDLFHWTIISGQLCVTSMLLPPYIQYKTRTVQWTELVDYLVTFTGLF